MKLTNINVRIPVKGRVTITAGIFALLTTLYLAAIHAYYVGFFNDDAFYIMGARALLKGCYCFLSMPVHPPLINYLPGTSLLLVPLVWMFPDNFMPYQITFVGFTVGAVLISLRWLSNEKDPLIKWGVFILTAVNPLTVSLSGAILSDIPFFLLTSLILLNSHRNWDKKTPRTWIYLSVLSCLSIYLRPAGFLFLFALIFSLFLERRWREIRVCVATSTLSLLPLLWMPPIRQGLRRYAEEYGGSFVANAGNGMTWISLGGATLSYGRDLVYRTMFRFEYLNDHPMVMTIVLGLVVLLIAIGHIRIARENKRIFPLIFLVFYSGLHIFWSKQSGRYLLPVFPMVIWGFLKGIQVITWYKPLNRILPGLLVAISLLSFVTPLVNIVNASLFKETPLTTPPRETLKWISENTPTDAIFAAELDGQVYLLTQRSTFQLPKLNTPDDFLPWTQWNHVRFILIQPNIFMMRTPLGRTMHDRLPDHLVKKMIKGNNAFRLKFSSTREGTFIYERVQEYPKI